MYSFLNCFLNSVEYQITTTQTFSSTMADAPKSKPRYFSITGQKIVSAKVEGKLYPVYSAFDVEKTTKETPSDAVRFVRREIDDVFPELTSEDKSKLMNKLKKLHSKMEASQESKKSKASKKVTKSEVKVTKPKRKQAEVEEVAPKRAKKVKASEDDQPESGMKSISAYKLFQSIIRKEVEKITERSKKRPNSTVLWTPNTEAKSAKWEAIKRDVAEGLKLTNKSLEKIVHKWAVEETRA
jgi:hypothetical protein